MNPRTTQDSFDEYLMGNSDLSRQYRDAGREEPPLHLDSQILIEARRAVAPKRRVRLLLPERWMLPLATAATLLLAVGVISVMSPWDKRITIPLEPAPQSATESARTVPESGADNETHSATFRQEPESLGLESPPTKSSKEAREATTLEEVPSMMDAPAAPGEDKQDSGSLRQGKTGELRSRSKLESRDALSSDEAPSQDDALLESELQEGGADFRIDLRQYQGAEPPDAPSDVDALGHSALDFETPEDWLAFIADLRRQGRHEQADASLSEFRKRFPDHPLDSSQAPAIE